MLFSLEVRRARKGDCLLLHYGSEDDPHLILIDGGPSGVYGPHLKPRIVGIHRARGLADEDPLPVDAVMVSHVDDDHIAGILELTREQRSGTPDLRLKVGSLWHNSFDDLLGARPKELRSEAGFGPASLNGEHDGDADDAMFDTGSVLASAGAAVLAGGAEVESEDEFQAVQVLASIPQGRQLRDDAKALGWKVNRAFKGRLILAAAGAKPIKLKGSLTVTVAGPMQPELLALQEAHDAWLRRRQRKTSPAAALAAFVDQSVPNLSSIVVLAQLEGKRMLLTGDARGDKILEGLESAGLLASRGKTHVDILKVPHHGSDNNMETVFFERVTADHYVFSGNGEHGNPERRTLEMLFEARGTKGYTMHFTYPILEIDGEREKDRNKERGKELKRGKPAREEWSHRKHSLTALFEQHGVKEDVEYRVVGDQKEHIIDLLSPVRF